MKYTKEYIAARRAIAKEDYDGEDEDYRSDQQLQVPPPPLTKAPVSCDRTLLPMDFECLELKNDTLALIRDRTSHRVYTGQAMTLLELSFLLWATQGIRAIRGNNYATLRTVPCGGARHEFETYLAVRDVQGLKPGAYHYLPMSAELEFIGDIADYENSVSNSLNEQKWGSTANVVFYWSAVPYRAEWRYGPFTHRVMLIDAGHICQNLYIACEALGLGTCAVASFDRQLCNSIFKLDDVDEFIVYTAPVGCVSAADKEKEDDFYAFLKKGFTEND
ncbi:MAG TPA: SagB/ThcOx family dehydrogenase [Eubacteriales bacterium]|nr:SagB/ThcOx family dehydrogenase [Clostridia bacterium]HRV73326.1 SagB/ThcOx family dehydrogenase [Eubacteriales bacterium]